MKKILLTLWISSLIPSAAFAEGSFFGNIVNRIFSGTVVQQVAAPADGSHLAGQIDNRVNPPQVQMQAPAYSQNPYPMQTVPAANQVQQQKANEDLVRCVHLADIISTSTELADQEKAGSAGKVYAGLHCNDLLKDYSHVVQNADQALTTCSENDNCGNTTITKPQTNGGIQK